jgi:L-2,4-diaminobutyrate decarboxylase
MVEGYRLDDGGVEVYGSGSMKDDEQPVSLDATLAASFDAGAFRALGHRVIDRLARHLAAADDGAVLPAFSPRQAVARLGPVPRTPASDVDEAFLSVIDDAIGTATRLHHRGFVGHQVATPLPSAALADVVAALLNNGMAIFEMGKGATALERAVLVWLAGALGLPATTSGVLTHGGSLGNLTALLAARQSRGADPWRRGVRGQPLVVFVAETAHYSVARAVRVLGLGDEGCVAVPVDDRLRLDVRALQDAITRARRQKKRPIAVVASAGSTAAGAFDPLDAIADVAEREHVWFHVDGAHGAALALSAVERHKTLGLARADSVVLDFHKMLLMPALVTAVLFRDGKAGAAAFAQQAGYLFDDADDDGWSDVGRRTVECTKRMLALPVWTTLQSLGSDALVAHVEHCCALARSFAALIDEHPRLELLTPPECNIVCFRVRGLDGGEHAALRRRILDGGQFYPVQVHLHARGLSDERQGLWLRTTLLNPRTTVDDLHRLLAEIASAAPA